MPKPNKIDDLLEDILNDVAYENKSIVKACRDRKVSPQTFWELKEADKRIKEQYTLATKFRAEGCIDTIEQIEQALADGKIDAPTARVLIDTEKWKACKFYPKMYGDKQEVEHTGTVKMALVEFVDGQSEGTDSEIIPTVTN